MREPAPGRLDFVHNTLKEYLAGDRFADLRDEPLLVEHALDPAWQPSVLFAAGSDIPDFADSLIERLLAAAQNPLSRGADTSRAIKLFAVRCGGVALHLSPSNHQRLNEIVETSNRPLAISEAESFAALGDFVVQYLKYDAQLPARTLVACVRTLRLIGTDAAKECLKGYCGERRATVVSELKQAVEPLELVVVQESLVAIVEHDPRVEERLQQATVPEVLGSLEELNLHSIPSLDLAPLAELPGLQRISVRGSPPACTGGLLELASIERLRGNVQYINSVGMHLALIPAGEFLMGAKQSEPDTARESPQHRVRITRPFLLGVYPVTQGEYLHVMGQNPSHFTGDDRLPVEDVSWFDAVRFCNRLSEVEEIELYYAIDGERVRIRGGTGYRLPTEAQWEYACRAETITTWCCGDDDNRLAEYAWFDENADRRTHPVGGRQSNAWGLYDMHGNVWEWCWDWFDEEYYASSPGVDPQGPSRGSCRVFRGGSWSNTAGSCRSAYRLWYAPEFRDYRLGFRVARSPSGESSQQERSR